MSARTSAWLGVLLMAPVLSTGCPQTEPPATADGGSASLLAEATIGPAGGTLTAEALSLTIPTETFSSDATISIYKYPASPIMPDDRSGPVYGIEGLPDPIGQPITVTIEDSSVTDPTVFLRHSGGYSTSFGPNSLVFGLPLETQLSAGVVTATIPATEEMTTRSAKPRRDALTGGPSEFLVWVAGDTAWLESASGKYKLCHPKRAFREEIGTVVLSALDSAHLKLEDLGLSWAQRTRWPVKVSLFSFPADAAERDAQEEPSKLGVNFHSLSVNYDRFKEASDFQELTATLGHELFHLMQFLYDPRNSFSQAVAPGAWLWMDEALSTWFEHRMTPSPSFIPGTVRTENYRFVLNALATNDKEHGYGASMFLKHLIEELGDDKKIGDLLKVKPNALRSPVEALESLVTPVPLGTYWNSFLDDYMAGTVYPTVFPSASQIYEMGMGRTPTAAYAFKTATDSGTTFSWEAPGLSARGYVVAAKHPWTQKTSIELTLNDAAKNGRAIIYKYKDPGLTWEKQGDLASGATYSHDGNSLFTNGELLVVMVSSSGTLDQQYGTHQTTLTVGKKSEPAVTAIEIHPPSGWTGVVKDSQPIEFKATLTSTGSTSIEWFDQFVSHSGLWCSWPTNTNFAPNWGTTIQWKAPSVGKNCVALYPLTARSLAVPAVSASVDIQVDFRP